MSRMPANMSLKAFAPRIASPDTTPLYSSMCLSWSVLVVVSSTPYLPSDHVPDRSGSYMATLNGDRRRAPPRCWSSWTDPGGLRQAQVLGQPRPGHAARGARNVLRRPRRNDVPAVRAAARAHVDQVVGGGEQVQVVVDDDDRGPGLQQPVEHTGQGGHVERVQAGRRLVEDVQRAALAAAQPGGDPQPLRLAAGQGWGGLAEPQVAQADVADGPQRRGDRGPAGEPVQGVVHAEAEHVGYGQAVDLDGQGGVVEAGAVAGRAADGDVGQILDVEVDVAEPAAGGALALAGVEREVPGLPAPPPRVGGLGEQPADLAERPGVGRGCGPRVLADRRGVDLDDLADAAEAEAADVPGRRRPAEQRPRGRDEAVQDEGGLARAGRAGQRGQALLREGGGDVVQVVQVADLD